MTVIDGVFCLDTGVIYKRETLSVVTLDCSEICALISLRTLQN